MASYLEGYGVDDARRGRVWKRLVLAATAALAVALALYFGFRNFTEKRQVTGFLEELRAKNYRAAYARWGCTEASPCRDYNFDRFMEDWSKVDAGAAQVAMVKSCDTGVIEVVRFGEQEVQLWIDRATDTIGFSPWTVPHNPNRIQNLLWEIMKHCDPYTKR